ncbi:hypothetical protein GEMRC1_013114 [Eukaryota sp. GEM-RC1]
MLYDSITSSIKTIDYIQTELDDFKSLFKVNPSFDHFKEKLLPIYNSIKKQTNQLLLSNQSFVRILQYVDDQCCLVLRDLLSSFLKTETFSNIANYFFPTNVKSQAVVTNSDTVSVYLQPSYDQCFNIVFESIDRLICQFENLPRVGTKSLTLQCKFELQSLYDHVIADCNDFLCNWGKINTIVDLCNSLQDLNPTGPSSDLKSLECVGEVLLNIVSAFEFLNPIQNLIEFQYFVLDVSRFKDSCLSILNHLLDAKHLYFEQFFSQTWSYFDQFLSTVRSSLESVDNQLSLEQLIEVVEISELINSHSEFQQQFQKILKFMSLFKISLNSTFQHEYFISNWNVTIDLQKKCILYAVSRTEPLSKEFGSSLTSFARNLFNLRKTGKLLVQ